VLLILFVGSLSSQAFAYGFEGHLIAGRLAEDLLCERATTEISALVGDADLGELGLWADRIRSGDEIPDSSPWHYLNIANGEPLAEFAHPPEGDVLWAIGHFSARLRDANLSRNERAEALKFLIHFVVDLHQPLHVGLVEDRGGNTISIEFRGETTNLHRFWDTHAIEVIDLSLNAYIQSLRRDLVAGDESVSLDPWDWAEESLRLRPGVYGFRQSQREQSAAYLYFAASITRERLGLAARRLAGTLNAYWCN